MITTVTADGSKEYEFIEYLKKRAQNSDKNVIPTVQEIIDNVRENGDKAVRDYTVKFDGKAPENAEISAQDIDALVSKCDVDYLSTVKKAAENIADFHKRQLRQSWLTTKKQRRNHGAEGSRLKARRNLCPGRHSGISIVGSYERYSRKNRGS